MKNETDALNVRILALQEKRAQELRLLKTQFQSTYESLKPLNLVKSTLKQVSASAELKKNILASAIGMGTGVISKKLLIGKSHNPIKNLFGTMLQFAVANVVSKQAKGVKSTIESLIHQYVKRREASNNKFHAYNSDIETDELSSRKKTFQH